MGWNPVKEAEKKAKSAIDKIIKPAVEAAEKAIKGVRHEAYWAVRKAGDAAESSVKKIEKECVSNVREVGLEAMKAVPKEVEKALKAAVNELGKAVTKEGLKTIREIVRVADRDLEKLAKSKPNLVEQINSLGFSLEIGPVTLSYSNFYTRTANVADVLDTYVNHPPELRREPIIKMIVALGPDSVDLGASVQLAAVVVASKELGVGGSLDAIGIELFAEIGDVVLEKIGVPE